MTDNIHFRHVKKIKRVDQISVHEVGEALERLNLVAAVEQETTSDIAHTLYVAQINPKDRISSQHVFQRLI